MAAFSVSSLPLIVIYPLALFMGANDSRATDNGRLQQRQNMALRDTYFHGSLYICSSRRQQQNIQIVHIIELLRQPGRYCIQFSAAHLLPSTIYRRVNFECEISFE